LCLDSTTFTIMYHICIARQVRHKFHRLRSKYPQANMYHICITRSRKLAVRRIGAARRSARTTSGQKNGAKSDIGQAKFGCRARAQKLAARSRREAARLSPYATASATATINAAGLASGTYPGRVTVTASGAAFTVPVTGRP